MLGRSEDDSTEICVCGLTTENLETAAAVVCSNFTSVSQLCFSSSAAFSSSISEADGLEIRDGEISTDLSLSDILPTFRFRRLTISGIKVETLRVVGRRGPADQFALLHSLDLRGNSLKFLDAQIAELPSLQRLWLSGKHTYTVDIGY